MNHNFQKDPRYWTDQEREAFAEDQYWRERFQAQERQGIQNQQSNQQPNQLPYFYQYAGQLGMQNMRQHDGQYPRQIIDNGNALLQMPQNSIQNSGISQQQIRNFVPPQIGQGMNDHRLQQDHIQAENSYLRKLLQQQSQRNMIQVPENMMVQPEQIRGNLPQSNEIIPQQESRDDIPHEFEQNLSIPQNLSIGLPLEIERGPNNNRFQYKSAGHQISPQNNRSGLNFAARDQNSLQEINAISMQDESVPSFSGNEGNQRQILINQSFSQSVRNEVQQSQLQGQIEYNQNHNQIQSQNMFGVSQRLQDSASNRSTPLFKHVSGENFEHRIPHQPQPNSNQRVVEEMKEEEDPRVPHNQSDSFQSGINKVKVNDQINYHSMVSSLKNKGKPVYHQVTPFTEARNDPQWEIPQRNEQNSVVRRQSYELALQKQIYEQKKILTVLEGIEADFQLMVVNQKKFSQEIAKALNIEKQQLADRNYWNQQLQNQQISQSVVPPKNQISEVGLQNELLREIIRINSNQSQVIGSQSPQSQDGNIIMPQQSVSRAQAPPIQQQINQSRPQSLEQLQYNIVEESKQSNDALRNRSNRQNILINNRNSSQELVNNISEQQFESPRSQISRSVHSYSRSQQSNANNRLQVPAQLNQVAPVPQANRNNDPEEERKQSSSGNMQSYNDSSPNSGLFSNRLAGDSNAQQSFGGRSLIHNQSLSAQSVNFRSNAHSIGNSSDSNRLSEENNAQIQNMPEMIREEESKNEVSNSENFQLQSMHHLQQQASIQSSRQNLFDSSRVSISENGMRSMPQIQEESKQSARINNERKRQTQNKKIKAILNPNYFSQITKQEPHRNQSHEFSLRPSHSNDLREPIDQKSSGAGSEAKKFDEIIQNIKKVVQQGGNYCLQRFNSFGMLEDDKEEEKKKESNEEESKRPVDMNESNGDLNFFAKMMEKESELQSHEFSKPLASNHSLRGSSAHSQVKSPQSNSRLLEPKKAPKSRSNSVTEKQLKDSQFNHSKLIRQIESLLQKLNIDFNEGIIIQMDLQEKLRLKQQIEQALETRDDFQRQRSFQKKKLDEGKQNKAFKCNLSESDGYPHSLSISGNRNKGRSSSGKKIQQMRHNYYKGKSAQKRQLLSQFQSSQMNQTDQSRLSAHVIDYDFYFKNNQGMFVVKSQVQYLGLNRIKRQVDIEGLMRQTDLFKQNQKDLYQELIYTDMLTVCFDIENVLVRKVNIFDDEQFQHLKEALNCEEEQYLVIPKIIDSEQDEQINENIAEYAKQKLLKNREKLQTIVTNYDIVNQRSQSSSNKVVSLPDNTSKSCCKVSQMGLVCICDVNIFQIRPYTYEMLRAIQPFFEIVATSFLPYNQIDFIIEFIETVLNKPIFDMNEKLKREKAQEQSANQNKNQRNKQKKRRVKKIDPKIYFQFLFSKTNYVHVKEVDENFENLLLLTINRKMRNIFLLSSNQLRILVAMDLGFCAIPIIKFDSFIEKDFQLNLVENYLLKLKYGGKNMKSKNQGDFGYLMNSTAIQRRHQNKLNENQTNESIFQKNASNYQHSSILSQKHSMSNQNSNLSFGEGLNGFHQLSLDIDCIIQEDQKGEQYTDSSKQQLVHSRSKEESGRSGMSANLKDSGSSKRVKGSMQNESIMSDHFKMGSSINSQKLVQMKANNSNSSIPEDAKEEESEEKKESQERLKDSKGKRACKNSSVQSLQMDDISDNSSCLQDN